MKTLTGSMFFNPLEGGIWALETEDGTRYQLDDVGSDARGEGRKITVTGDVDDGIAGFGMLYPIFKVQEYKVEEGTGRPTRRPRGIIPRNPEG